MRVTNKMIMNNASSNINTTKEFVNQRNTQMTSQKKIDRPSDDPVIAVRSLRLSTTLSQVTQYHEKNIPDAAQWISVTETALINMREIGNDCKQIANKGATDTFNSQDDRKTMLKELEQLQKQLFAEGNADYANRTVFTGYRTNCNLTFTEDELNTAYEITQTIAIEGNMEDHRYYDGDVIIPTTETELLAPSLKAGDTGYDPAVNKPISDIVKTNFYRIRLAYDKIAGLAENINIKVKNPAVNPDDYTVISYESEAAWSEAQGGKVIPKKTAVLIRETGDLILSNDTAEDLKKADAELTIKYNKKGFEEGELRPEYYYNCVKTEDPLDVHVPVTYTKYNENGERKHFDIEYTIAASQTIGINTEAADVFDSSIYRDVTEMIDACQHAVSAYDKMQALKDMKSESQYASNEDQEWLDIWYKAAEKEFDFYHDNMRKLFDAEIGKIDKYYAKINLAITDLGCKKDSLDLTKNRVGDQQQTVQSLQSLNDDIDLSKIIIDYTAAYTAYQASLTAAGKLGDSTLLNYI